MRAKTGLFRFVPRCVRLLKGGVFFLFFYLQGGFPIFFFSFFSNRPIIDIVTEASTVGKTNSYISCAVLDGTTYLGACPA